MCSNCNNMNSYNNPNLINGTVGFAIENGNNAVLGANTLPFNTGEVISTNINTGCLNNNCNNNSCNCNSCGCNCNGCNSNNNSCGCNCNGNNNSNDNDNVTNNNLQENLRNFIGRRVTLEFNNCGSCSKKTGVLTCVGCNFVTLRSVNNNTCLLADTAGLNFVTVHNCQC